MAKQKKGYVSATDSIYDFLFTESKKPPNKVRPVKATGIDATDGYLTAVTAALEDPLLYINKATEDAIRDVGNIDLGEINIGPDGKVKFSSGNIKDILNNDMKFVDKAFERMETTRKLGRASAFGWTMTGLVAGVMARQAGLDAEAQDAFRHLGKSTSNPVKNLDTKARSASLAEKQWAKADYANISEAVLKSIYGEKQGSQMYKAIQDIDKKYEAEKANGSAANFSKIFTVDDNSYLTLYPIFESVDLSRKERDAKALAQNARTRGDEDKAKDYEEKAKGYKNAQNLVMVFGSDGSKDDFRHKYAIQKGKELKSFQTQLENLRKSNDPNAPQQMREIEKQAREIQTQLRNFKWQDRAMGLGKLETYRDSIDQSWKYVMGGELIPAIISGDFFDPRKNKAFDWQPTINRDFDLGVKGRSIQIHMAKSANPFKQRYYDAMTEVYYWTPTGIVSTLTTGEGFAYQAMNLQKQLLRKFNQSDIAGVFGKDFDFTKLFGGERESYLLELQARFGDKKYQKLLGFLSANEKTFERFKGLQKTANRFGWIGRGTEKIKGFFTGKFASATKGLRERFARRFLKNIKGDAAQKLIENWLEKGGVKVLVEGLKASIKAALGASSGGLSNLLNFVVDIAVDVAIQLAEKMAKPIIKVMLTLLVVVVLGVAGMYIYNVSSFFSIFGQYSHVAPNEIILGDPDYTVPYGGDFPGDLPPGGVDFPLYSGGAADIFYAIASEFGVSATLVDCAGSTTEGFCGRILGGWCYAGNGKVYCEMSRIPESAYNSIFRHEMMHFVQGWYFPRDIDIKYREWGADYMSNNGGWYCVEVNGVLMRATTAAEIFKREGHCSEEDLINLAYRRVDSVDPSCSAYFHSRLKSAQTGSCN